jgi:ParB/RepB/Spo0J family partition protein
MRRRRTQNSTAGPSAHRKADRYESWRHINAAPIAVNAILHEQQLPDEVIEDSPYQARQPFNAASLAELAQGMRAASFQGVLIVRPHGEPAKHRHGLMQLVYGHRRRAAWRLVCAERSEICRLPVVVREVSDEQMLLIGAQENLQRQDLDPVEEAQIVPWHERLFFDKNQAEIGAMLGKSSDWVSVRSRIHKLPDLLKDRLRQRPRAISQILELGSFYTQEPEMAMDLADRVVHQNLTLEAIRSFVRSDTWSERRMSPDREVKHNRRGAATSVQDVTNLSPAAAPEPFPRLAASPERQSSVAGPPLGANLHASRKNDPVPTLGTTTDRYTQALGPVDDMMESNADLLLLQEAAAALVAIAIRAATLPTGLLTEHALDQAEQAVTELRRALVARVHIPRAPQTKARQSL